MFLVHFEIIITFLLLLYCIMELLAKLFGIPHSLFHKILIPFEHILIYLFLICYLRLFTKLLGTYHSYFNIFMVLFEYILVHFPLIQVLGIFTIYFGIPHSYFNNIFLIPFEYIIRVMILDSNSFRIFHSYFHVVQFTFLNKAFPLLFYHNLYVQRKSKSSESLIFCGLEHILHIILIFSIHMELYFRYFYTISAHQ